MRMLITSGGTKIKIDQVRSITNTSSGAFGSSIARAAIWKEHQVAYLVSKGGDTPFSCKSDFNDANLKLADAVTQIRNSYWFAELHRHQYEEHQYVTFDDYASKLRELCGLEFDVIVLAAAVSDYAPASFVEGKIRSKDDMTIHLSALPKLISEVKKIAPKSLLVGFKLLVGASDDELITAARDSITSNGCDIIVANDLNSLKNGSHRILIVTDNNVKTFEANSYDSQFLARTLIEVISEKHSNRRIGQCSDNVTA